MKMDDISFKRIFYKKANIPVITDCKACERMIKILNKNAKIRVIPNKCRSMPIRLRRWKTC